MSDESRKVTRLPGAKGGPEIDINDRIGQARAFIDQQCAEPVSVINQLLGQGITVGNASLLETRAAILAQNAAQQEIVTTRIMKEAGVRFTGKIVLQKRKAVEVKEEEQPPAVDHDEEEQAAAYLAAMREQQRKERN